MGENRNLASHASERVRVAFRTSKPPATGRGGLREIERILGDAGMSQARKGGALWNDRIANEEGIHEVDM